MSLMNEDYEFLQKRKLLDANQTLHEKTTNELKLELRETKEEVAQL